MLAEVRTSITAPDTPFGVKLLLLEQLERANIAADLTGELEQLLLDTDKGFTERGSAADALAGFESGMDWAATVERLRQLADFGLDQAGGRTGPGDRLMRLSTTFKSWRLFSPTSA